MSSTSTELKALSKGALTVQAFHNVLADIHLKLHDATVLQGDNKSAITVAVPYFVRRRSTGVQRRGLCLLGGACLRVVTL